jgi:phytoene dehydrogenase-like protein
LDLVNELFTDEKIKIHLLKFATEMLIAPEEKGTGLALFTMPGFVHTYTSGIPVGGSGALVNALTRLPALSRAPAWSRLMERT